MSFITRLRKGWNVFTGRDPTKQDDTYEYRGTSYYYRPDQPRLRRLNGQTIINSIYNRMATDVAAIKIQHADVDQNGRFLSERKSWLNNCLTLEANLDQTSRDFIMDTVLSMFDEGVVALVPTEVDVDPDRTDSYDICEMRVGKIIRWKPYMVQVHLYDARDGNYYDIWVPKRTVAIVTNPFYNVMNATNSTLQRLLQKMAMLDKLDSQSASGKLDLIIQLPYVINSPRRQQQAEMRLKSIEDQLSNSAYGIAYTDGTEHITQLNRPVENTLNAQIESLTNLLYAQLGITQEILNGTAGEDVMMNYYSRTIEPIVAAIADELKRKFLTKTARSQGQSIWFFRDPFKLVPVSQIADIADKFTRNEILSSNEIRGIIGYKPSDDPNADQLRNSNLNHPDEGQPAEAPVDEADAEAEEEEENTELTDEEIDRLLAEGPVSQQLMKEEMNQNGI